MVEYGVQIFSLDTAGRIDKYDIEMLNALARDGWRVVSSCIVFQTRLIYTLERELK